MGDPEHIGQIIDFLALRERFRQWLRSPEELAGRDADLARMARQGRVVGDRLASLVDWDAITRPDALVQDEHCRAGIEWMHSYRMGEPGVCLWGARGSGKTTLACHLLHRLDADGYTVALVSVPALLDRLAGDRRHRGEIVEQCGAVDALVLDDMGAASWERGWGGLIWEVADARWQGRRRGGVTILTTNLDPVKSPTFGWQVPAGQDMADWERAIDRLVALAPSPLEYGGPSRRGR